MACSYSSPGFGQRPVGTGWLVFQQSVTEENVDADGSPPAHAVIVAADGWIRGGPVMHHCFPSVPLILAGQYSSVQSCAVFVTLFIAKDTLFYPRCICLDTV